MGKSFLSDPRCWLLGLLGLLCFVLARWTVSPDAAMILVSKCGYWVMLAGFVLFVRAMWRVGREAWSEWRPIRFDVGALGLVLVVGCIWQTHEPKGFKILADEVLLVGTSMDMHYDREVTYPVRATDVQGPFHVLQGVLDKRPFFYPFVVSLVHDLTGYRVANAFYVNVVLGFVFLGLVYLLGTGIGGSRWAGIFGVLLCGGLPLLAQQAAGAGFELLNLVMLALGLLLARRYAGRRDDISLEALCLATVMLAMTRYESVIFVLPVAGLVIWGWMREHRVILPWSMWLIPVLLTPYVLQNRIFGARVETWQLAVPGTGATEPFALHYLPGNMGHALAFFFDNTGYQPSSATFAVLGLLALPFFGIWITRVLRDRNRVPADMAVAWLGLGLLAINALYMVYFWGQFDDPVIHRLSLPLHFCMLIAIWVVLSRWARHRLTWRLACGVAAVAMLFQGLPLMAKRAYERDYIPGIEMAWRQEFLGHFPARDYLFIDRDSVFWITQRIPATPIAQAQLRKEGLAYHLRNHTFSAMYVFQVFNVDDQTGKLKLDAHDDLGPDFTLEPVWEKKISTLVIGRISRITAITNQGRVDHATEFVRPYSGPGRTPEELEKARQEYLENWIKQLP